MPKVGQRVICVDDQQEILDLLSKHLAEYECDYVSSAAEALTLLAQRGPYAVVISDYDMPETNGIELLREIKTRSPDTVGIMLTGHDDLDIAVAALHEGSIFRFLNKPWDRETLTRHLDSAIEQNRVVTTERLLSEALSEANQTLQRKVEQLEDLNQLVEYWVEFSPAVIFSLNVDEELSLKPSYVSKNFSKLTGYERTELIVKPDFWFDHIHPDDLDAVQESLSEFINSTDTMHSVDYRFRHRDGSIRWILESRRAVRGADGSALEIVGAWMDITTSKQAAA